MEVVSWLSFIYVRYDPIKVFCPDLSNLNAVTFGGKGYGLSVKGKWEIKGLSK